MTKLTRLFAAAMTLLAPRIAAAEAPPLIPVQGFLSTADGKVIEGKTKLTFSLYDRSEPTGSEKEVLFREQQEVSVAAGSFTAYLGDKEMLPLTVFRDKSIVFVGIRVNDETEDLKPLVQLATAPFAAHSNTCSDAQTVGGKSVNDIILAAAPQPGSSTSGGGTVGPRGPAGPAGPAGATGPKGDPGVVSVSGAGRVGASLQNGMLAVELAPPVAAWRTDRNVTVRPGLNVLAWTEAIRPARTICQVTLTGWINNGEASPQNNISVAARVDQREMQLPDALNMSVPFFPVDIGTTSVLVEVEAAKSYQFGCALEINNGATSATCRISVLCP